MYKNIIIPIIISIVSFILMVGTCIIGNFLPSRIPTGVKVTILAIIFLAFLVFAFSIVPVMIWLVLRGTIFLCSYLKETWHIVDSDFRVKLLNFLIQNQERVFYGLLIFIWGIFIIGLAIALPVMIKEGFFKKFFTLLQ